MKKFKTELINTLNEKTIDLEILNQRVIHLSSDQYSIENGLINTKELAAVREQIKHILKNLDDEIYSYMDDGR